VANLWDVTDKDIDRFSQAVLTSWISGSSSSSDAAAAGGAGGADMSAAVAAARAACKLPHLVGAAPVCYGLPASMAFA
jgi:separase